VSATAFFLLLVLAAYPFQFWQRSIRTWIFSLAMLCLGELSVAIQNQQWLPNYFNNQLQVGRLLKLRVVEPLVEKNKSYKTIAEVVAIVNQQQELPTAGKIVLYIDKESLKQTIAFGDIIYAKNNCRDLQDAPNPFEFSPKKHLAHKSIYKSCFLKKGDFYLSNHEHESSIISLGYQVRDYCISVFKEHGLKGDEFAVAAAMIVGFEDELNPQIISYFSASGAMHLLSVSGLHIAFVYIILSFFLKPLRRFKWGSKFEFWFTVFVLWFYAIVTGFSPPVLRSAIMFSFAVYAKTFAKQINMFNVLATAALFILVVDPLALLDVGFQLSFLALLSILLVQPHLNTLYSSKHYLIQKCWELIAVSISATVLTLPFTFYYFHQFPNYFLLVNIVVIPLSTLLLYIGFAAIVFSWIKPLASFLVFLLKYVTWSLNQVLQFDERLPFSVTPNIQFSVFSIFLLLLAISFFLYHLNLNHHRSRKLALILFALFMLSSTIEYASKLEHRSIVFYSIKKHTAIDFIDAYHTVLVADDSLLKKEYDLKFHVYPNRMAHYANEAKDLTLDSVCYFQNLIKEGSIITFYHKIILIPNLNDSNWLWSKRLDVDYLVLNGQPPKYVRKLLQHVHANKVIIESVYHGKVKERVIQYVQKKNFPYWDVQKMGAWVDEF
jgi:competence protein ComEC